MLLNRQKCLKPNEIHAPFQASKIPGGTHGTGRAIPPQCPRCSPTKARERLLLKSLPARCCRCCSVLLPLCSHVSKHPPGNLRPLPSGEHLCSPLSIHLPRETLTPNFQAPTLAPPLASCGTSNNLWCLRLLVWETGVVIAPSAYCKD